jgi:hypothetical protein
MAMVILFGGGDGGGLYITASGVRPIPPFDPFLRRELKGLASLVSATAQPGGDAERELAQLVNKLSNVAIGQIEAAVGPLDGDVGLVYMDEDGGFRCGSTGKPPVPIPWPPRQMPSFHDLVETGALDQQVVSLVDAATRKGTDVISLLEEPEKTAAELGLSLSERAAGDLRAIAPSRLTEFRDPVDREVVEYFHSVLRDGTRLADWTTRPTEVAKAVGVELSAAAVDRVLAVAGSGSRLDPGTVQNPVAIAVVVGVVIMLVDRPADLEHLAVRDRSRRVKF